MTLWNSIRIALAALRLNAFRSFLTMLGIIIGISSVIVMVSVSSGAKMAVENFINSLGTNMLMIRPGAGMFVKICGLSMLPGATGSTSSFS